MVELETSGVEVVSERVGLPNGSMIMVGLDVAVFVDEGGLLCVTFLEVEKKEVGSSEIF